MVKNLEIRRSDIHGDGHYYASRGNRKHNGLDLVYQPGQVVKCFAEGLVTKLGYAYSDDLSYRYVQVTDIQGLHCRYFYVAPSVKIRQSVREGFVLGKAQEIGRRYPGITPHIHFEVLVRVSGQKVFLNPLQYLRALGYGFI